MEHLLPLAAKSLLVAGATLALLRLMQKRSAADRSLVAHLGLSALLMLPLIAFAFPALQVEGPAFMANSAMETGAVSAVPSGAEAAAAGATFQGAAEPLPAVASPAPIDWAFWAYAAPAGLLVLLTLIALLRLIPLKARASVLVEPHWLTALAHAQRRMGFKNGTALLTSDDIRSPISWGLMRPVILLNGEAANAHEEAEAIIAHELAHVAGFDWAKLLVSRIAVAIFWFNRWSGCSPARRISCARKRPTMRCSTAISKTPIMPASWSASPSMSAAACFSARTASLRRATRSPAASSACSTRPPTGRRAAGGGAPPRPSSPPAWPCPSPPFR